MHLCFAYLCVFTTTPSILLVAYLLLLESQHISFCIFLLNSNTQLPCSYLHLVGALKTPSKIFLSKMGHKCSIEDKIITSLSTHYYRVINRILKPVLCKPITRKRHNTVILTFTLCPYLVI